MKPQAIWLVCPIITPGNPENVKPPTSYGQAGVTSRQRRFIWYQIDGRVGARCGSLASIGAPLAVRSPLTTHEFDPMPLPAGPSTPSSIDHALGDAA